MMALNPTAAHLCLAVGLVSGIRAEAIAADYPDALTHDNPVAYFRFESHDGNHVRDSLAGEPPRRRATSHALDLSAEGALLTRQGTANHAAHFTGASYVHVTADPDVYDFAGALSIEFWIRPTKGGGAAQDFIAKGEYTRTDTNYYVLYFQEPSDEFGRLRFGIADGHIDQVMVGCLAPPSIITRQCNVWLGDENRCLNSGTKCHRLVRVD